MNAFETTGDLMRLLAFSFITALFTIILINDGVAQTGEGPVKLGPGIVKGDDLIALKPNYPDTGRAAEFHCVGFNMPIYKGDENVDSKMLFAPIDDDIKFNMPVIGRDTTCQKNTGE